MGAILAILMALNMISGSSKAIEVIGGKTYNLYSSSVSSYGENYSYTDQYVKDSMGRVVYEIRSSCVVNASGQQIFTFFGGTLDGYDDYKVMGKGVYKNNKLTLDLH